MRIPSTFPHWLLYLLIAETVLIALVLLFYVSVLVVDAITSGMDFFSMATLDRLQTMLLITCPLWQWQLFLMMARRGELREVQGITSLKSS